MDLLRFVDSITAAPSLRLDLNDGVTWGLRYEGTDMSPPPLRQSWSGTLLADGELQSAAAYANRRIRLSLDLITASVDAAAAQLQALWRELNRPSNVLMWQPEGATNPLFFRTLRSSDNQVTEFPGAGGLRTVDVEIVAEPFGYGVKQTLSAVTVNNDPAAASNGMFFDITGVKGDVETPLFLSVDALDVVATGRRQSCIAVRRRGNPANVPLALQVESMTLGTDTTLQANDPAMSGSGQNFARCTFATSAGFAVRAAANSYHPAAPSVDARGTYRIFARTRKTVAGDVIQLRPQIAPVGPPMRGDTVTLPADTSIRWIDLGLIQCPLGPDPVVDGYSGTPLAAKGMYVNVEATRVSGTGSLDLDALIFVPADDRLCMIKWSESSGPTAFVLDSASNQVYAVDDVGAVRPEQNAEISGGPPMVSPGVTNRLFFVRDVGTTATAGDSKQNIVDITPYYWPRYLYVRPATS